MAQQNMVFMGHDGGSGGGWWKSLKVKETVMALS